jgi:hypothetical protein
MVAALLAAAAAALASAAVPYNQIVALNQLFSATNGRQWKNSFGWGSVRVGREVVVHLNI